MFNRLRWIAVSYLSSRLVQGLLLAAIVTFGLSLWEEHERQSYRITYPSFQLPRTDLQNTPRAQYAGVEDLTLKPYQDPSPLHGLKYLRRLELWTFESHPEQIAFLAGVPNLTVVVWHTMWGDDRTLREFAKLPHLEMLVVDDESPPQHPSTISRSGFAALSKAPALKTLYAGSLYDFSDQKLERVARSALPGKTVLPEYEYDSPIIFSFGPFVLLAIAIGIQLSRQFSNPLRALAPGYVSSQAIFALGAILLTSVLAALHLSRIVGDPVVAIAFSAAIVSAGVATASGSNPAVWKMLAVSGRPTWKVRFVAHVYGLTVAAYVLILEFPAMAHWVFSRPTWWIPAAFFGSTIISVAYGLWMLSRLLDWSAGGSVPTSGATLLAQSRSWNNTPNFRGIWSFAPIARERKIDRWQRSSFNWNWWNRVARWRVGNSPRPQTVFFFLIICVFIPIAAIVQLVLSQPANIATQIVPAIRATLILGASLFTVMTTMMVAHTWRSRMTLLPREQMLPVANYALREEWIAAFLLDLLPGPVLIAATAAFAHAVGAKRFDWLETAQLFAATFLLAMSLAAAIASWAVVERSSWVLLVEPVILVIVVAVACVDSPNANLAGQMTVVAMLVSIVGILSALRWLRIEAA